MTTVSIKEAEAKLSDIIHRLTPGDEVIITENDLPIARLVPTVSQRQRRLGSLRGTVSFIAPDFDAPLDDFKGYMQ
ncbi:MAG: type II toxin-antitoxin system prevent-host-death family antitoxin [Acidobacteria bacterium]|nr:type II toxin-antitoxin system prevent-host-death family antitoxin [Acidobacteriota bacterium]